MNYYDYYRSEIDKDRQAAFESAEKVREYIADSTAIYHGEPIKTLHVPKIFSKEQYEALAEAGRITYGILEKITNRYIEDPEYRKLFPYPESLSRLVLTDRKYDTVIPICRLDIFFNEEDFSFKFCEINTDGTSGMVEDLELNRSLKYNNVFQEYQKNHELKTFELYSGFVKVFIDIYYNWLEDPSAGLPYVAIADYLEGSYLSDFIHFKKAFEAAGCKCEIVEITDLKYENGKLISPTGYAIDAVYRRAVTTDIYDNLEKTQAFIQAAKDGAFCCIGNFCTQVAHNKAMFKVIRDKETREFLTEEENRFVEEHFPFTGYLNSGSTGTDLTIDDVIATKDRWILKPLDLYGAREISVGSDFSEEDWKKKVDGLKDKGYLFQEYCMPYKTLNIALEDKKEEFSEWINMTGLYMYGGKLAGFFSRLAPNKVIAGHYGGRTIATLVETD